MCIDNKLHHIFGHIISTTLQLDFSKSPPIIYTQWIGKHMLSVNPIFIKMTMFQWIGST